MARLLIYLGELVLLAFILRKVARAFSHLFSEPRADASSWRSGSTARPGRETVEGKTARDPICGMFVSTELSERLTAGDSTLHFCSRECLERYQKTHV